MTSLWVPPEVISMLGTQKRLMFIVTVNAHSYRSTAPVYGDVFMLPLSAEHREVADVKGGDPVEVTIELDREPQTVDLPDDLAVARAEQSGARDIFDALSNTMGKESVQHVEFAKAPATRERRIAELRQSSASRSDNSIKEHRMQQATSDSNKSPI